MAYDCRHEHRRKDGTKIHRKSDKWNQIEAYYLYTPRKPCKSIDPSTVAVMETQNQIQFKHFQEYCQKLGIKQTLGEEGYSKVVARAVQGQFGSK